MRKTAKKTGKTRHASLAGRIIRAIAAVLLLFGIVLGIVGLTAFTNAFRNEYDETTYHMARTSASVVNGDRLSDYLENGADAEYEKTNAALSEFSIDMNVSLIYVIVVDRSDYGSFRSVFNVVNNTVDNSVYTAWELGHARDTTNREYREKYRAIYEEGSTFETVYRFYGTGEYHPHITAMVPVKGKDGTVKGIVCIQRPVRELTDAIRPYVISVLIDTIVLGIAASYLAARYIRRQFVSPVEKISAEATRFARENTKGVPLGKLSDIGEISDLAVSLDTLETEMAQYIADLTTATREKERISTELTLASTIQENAIPNVFPAFPDRTDFDIFASMTPAQMVGGDFYNFMLVDDDHLAMWIGDVSGKGIPAALFMMSTNLMIAERTRLGGSPAEILAAVNNNLCENNKAEMFVTVWLGILELSTGSLVAANAGHEYPAMCRNGRFELVEDRHGFVLGGMRDMKYRNETFALEPGTKLFVYSDGVPEASDAAGAMFQTERMLNALNAAKDGTPEELLRSVKDAVDRFVNGAEQFDDLTMLCVAYRPAQN